MTILRNRLLAAATLCILGALTTAAATAQPTYDFNLPQQSLAAALRAIGQQTTMNILFEPATVENLTAPAVRGLLSPEEAIQRVLVGTKLVVEKTAANSLLIAPAATAQVTSREANSSDSELRLARSESVKENADAADRQNPDSSAEDSENKIQEILVTAQKRGEERLRDVPLPISVINAENLVDNNQLKLQDFFTSVPGITLTAGIFGESQVGIRGIKTTNFEQPVTAILVDDVPYTMSSQEGNGWMSPDIDPGNLARVEVLRGPQGTLYGASSMGGLIKYVTVDPSPDRVSGRLQVGSTTVKNGDGVGYNVRGSVNVPLSDTLAVRASGFTRREPGYIDNRILGDPANRIERGVNETDAYGGHVALLWRPSEQFSAKISALFQRLETKGAAYSLRPELGDLQQNFLRGSGWFKRESRVVSATLNAKLGRANLRPSRATATTRIPGRPTTPTAGLLLRHFPSPQPWEFEPYFTPR